MFKARHLFLCLSIAVLSTAASLWALVHLIEPLLTNPQPVHDFFFNRSPIQWLTLTAFFFTLTALAHRVWSHARVRSALHALTEQALEADSTLVSQRCARVQECKVRVGSGAAARYNRDLAQRDEESLERVYGLFNQALQFIVALGLFGTIWGISQQMLSSFATLDSGNPEHLKTLLSSFGVALSTALDTTILALVCSLVLSVLMTPLQWLEMNALRAVTAGVDQRLSLEFVAYAPYADLLDVARTHLLTLTHNMLRAIRAGMEPLVTDLIQTVDTALRDLGRQHLDALQEHERDFHAQLVEQLAQHKTDTVRALEAQGEQVRSLLAVVLQQVVQQLQQAPEVSIRYPQTNGAAHPRPLQDNV
jgi:biopolymer transport protein ExbB/TolQ